MRRLTVSFFILLLMSCANIALAQRGGYRPPPLPPRPTSTSRPAPPARPTITLPPRPPRITVNRPPRTPDSRQQSTSAAQSRSGQQTRATTTVGGPSLKAPIPPAKSPQIALARTQANTKLAQLRASLRSRLLSSTALSSGNVRPPKPPAGGGGNSGGGRRADNNISKVFNNASATNAQWLSQVNSTIQSKIPKQLGQSIPVDKGVGLRWNDNKGNSIRIMRGNPSSQYIFQRRDYIRISSNGRTIGPDGKPRSGRANENPEVHIPLEDWLTWKTWDRP